MPLHHAREPYASPAGLIQTLIALGAGGVVFPGTQAWTGFPRASAPVNIVPNVANETDGAAAVLVPAAVITVPYYVTHFVFSSAAAGDFWLRFKLQSSTPTIYRTLRANNERTAGPNGGIQSPSFMPFPVAANLGTQAIVATSPGAGPTQQGYAITLTQSLVHPVADLLVAAPTANGGLFPADTQILGTVAQTSSVTAWAWGNYVQITPGLPTACLITGIWGQIGESVTNISAAFASGAPGGEVDWGIFVWPTVAGTDDCDARHRLWPYPLFLPANTPLAVRARSAGTTAVNFQTSLEYIPLPLR